MFNTYDLERELIHIAHSIDGFYRVTCTFNTLWIYDSVTDFEVQCNNSGYNDGWAVMWI